MPDSQNDSTLNPQKPPQTSSKEALVEFEEVQKTYDGKSLVVRDLNMRIEEGEFISLLGPSGSGKTTTLMMLAGFESPTAGEIKLAGHSINKTPPHQRGFGMVFQNYALFPHMTVRDNIAFALRTRKTPAAEQDRMVKEALDMVRMQAMADRYPGQLSGGQQQRVALARALVFKPRLVLMDEPLGALDKQLREHMQVELKAIHRQLGLTFVYVTHDQSEALTMSNRVAVFNDGMIQQVADVHRLYETPNNQFVATFVGDSTVLRGVVERTDAQLASLRMPTGEILQGCNVNSLAAGDAASAVMRPERIVLKPRGQSDASSAVAGVSDSMQANCVWACVKDLIYYGDHLRLRALLPSERGASAIESSNSQDELSVKLPLAQSHGLVPGQTVCLYFPPQHLRIYR